MGTVLRIALEEWRLWRRSQIALGAAAVVLVLAALALIATASRLHELDHSRGAMQEHADERFLEQPDRHPHRMVHYGHYVFRTPAPLSVLDPGVDSQAGTALFLEGHRQNSTTFAPGYSSASSGALSGLTPATVYQLLVPLLLIVVGFSVLSREREQRTDRLLLTAGVRPRTLWAGKTLALAGFALLLLAPLVIGVVLAWLDGAGVTEGLLFLAGYGLYLGFWVTLIAAVSAWTAQPSLSLTGLLLAWLTLCVLAPPAVSSLVTIAHPTASKIESDLAVVVALRELGDGHNAQDPAFAQLRNQLFAQYGVDRVEDLPVNFRGVVAQRAEADLTAVLNRFSAEHKAREAEQVRTLATLAPLTPQLAVQLLSRRVAGTDLSQHHEFQNQAEALRFDFVQRLNGLHASALSYADDVGRGRDEASSQRARIDAQNWQEVLSQFEFVPAPSGGALPMFLILIAWIAVGVIAGLLGTGRRVGGAHG